MMTVKGNVISCDECGRQISMPMESESGGKQSLDERAREHATREGWKQTDGTHLCPDHGSNP
jgi:hypothetical protein